MKKITLIFVIFSSLFAVVAFYLFSDSTQSAQNTVHRDEGTSVVSSDKSNSDRVTPVQPRRKRTLADLGYVLNHTRDKVQNEEGELTGGEIMNIVTPHYFEMAPLVLEDMYQEQEVDLSWTSDVEQDAEQLFAEVGFDGTTLQNVECRKSLCKVEFSHENDDMRQGFLDGRMDEGPWIAKSENAFGSSEEQEDGTVRSFVYFTQPGDGGTFWDMRKKMAKMIEENKT